MKSSASCWPRTCCRTSLPAARVSTWTRPFARPYGGVSGLITIEDVLEEIVGEIGDEYDEDEEALIQPLGGSRYQVQALTPIEDLNEKFGSNLSDDDYDTVGGLLLAEFGRVPEFDEVMTLADRFEFRVTKADNRRIITLEMNVLER